MPTPVIAAKEDGAPASQVEVIPHFIGGARTQGSSSRLGEVYNPALGKPAHRVALGNKADVDRAVEAAEAAFPLWTKMPPVRRPRILNNFLGALERNLSRLAHIITSEHGKTASDAEGEIRRGMEVVEFALGIPQLIKGVVNGDKEAVDALLGNRAVAALSFVGSTPVAEYVYTRGTAAGKRVQALGGAKNHMVILPDADLDQAVNPLIGAAFGSAGERCMAISVAVPVGDELADALVKQLTLKLSELKIGPGDSPRTEMGPL